MEISSPTDEELSLRTERLAASERASTTDLVEHLAEFDLRRLWREERFSSMFDCRVVRLRLSEGSAFKRLRAARAARRFPILLEMLERVRSLLRRKYQDGRLDGVFLDALKALLARKDPVIGRRTRTRRRATSPG